MTEHLTLNQFSGDILRYLTAIKGRQDAVITLFQVFAFKINNVLRTGKVVMTYKGRIQGKEEPEDFPVDAFSGDILRYLRSIKKAPGALLTLFDDHAFKVSTVRPNGKVTFIYQGRIRRRS